MVACKVTGAVLPCLPHSVTADASEIVTALNEPVAIRERAAATPDAVFKADAYVGTSDEKAVRGITPMAVASTAMLLAALAGSGGWYWKRRRQDEN